MSDPQITEEMIDKAAHANAEGDGYDWVDVSQLWQERYRRQAAAGLEAALAGRTVLDLPEPAEVDPDATIWHVGPPNEAVTVGAMAENGSPVVEFSNAHDDGLRLPASLAREFFTAGLASCDAADRLASLSSKGGEPRHE